MDGDSDIEDDDPAGNRDEDGIATDLHHEWNGKAGCDLSDVDGEGEDHE